MTPAVIHVNRQHIGSNAKDGLNRPVYTIKRNGEVYRKKEVSYAEYIERICQSGNRIAIYVKLSDQEDNLDPIRWMSLNTFMQNALSKRYRGVRQKLLEAAFNV